MYLIGQVYNEKEHFDEMCIYKLERDIWQCHYKLRICGGKSLVQLLQPLGLRLDYAIIDLNQIYRNSFYYLYPDIQVIIDKKAIIRVFNQIVCLQTQAYEEAAVLLDPKVKIWDFMEVYGGFIHDFYRQSSKQDAIAYYEKWQTNRPLTHKDIDRFISIMEFYYDEIMNYFERPYNSHWSATKDELEPL